MWQLFAAWRRSPFRPLRGFDRATDHDWRPEADTHSGREVVPSAPACAGRAEIETGRCLGQGPAASAFFRVLLLRQLPSRRPSSLTCRLTCWYWPSLSHCQR